jgi:hypothetical protein
MGRMSFAGVHDHAWLSSKEADRGCPAIFRDPDGNRFDLSSQ